MIKLKIICHNKFINIIKSDNDTINVLILINHSWLPNIIDNICLENKEIFEDIISFYNNLKLLVMLL